ncbi:hypothetical protein MMYC01_210573, partial [Madurella mycetomatis]
MFRTDDFRSPYYVMITIWYLIKNKFESASTPGMKNLEMRNSVLAKVLPPDNFHFDKDTEGEVLMLKWLYYGSISQLINQTNGSWLHSTWEDGGRLQERILKLRRAAKIALAAKVSSKRPYVPSDEAVDRLAFLAHELGLEEVYHGAHICSLVMSRVRSRAYTTALNPGWRDSQGQGSDLDLSAPWEIFALSHHSRLLMANLEGKRRRIEEVEKYRSKFSPFLTANVSLIPCWERTSMASCQAWLRSETAAVLATTLLDVYLKDMKPPLKTKTELEVLWALNKKLVPHCDQQQDDYPPIDWTKFKPLRRYHPQYFFRSLCDTPEKYDKAEMGRVRIPSSLRDYLRSSDAKKFEARGWTTSILRDLLARDDVVDISVMDIPAFYPNDEEEIKPSVFGRLQAQKAPPGQAQKAPRDQAQKAPPGQAQKAPPDQAQKAPPDQAQNELHRITTAEFDSAGAWDEADYKSRGGNGPPRKWPHFLA